MSHFIRRNFEGGKRRVRRFIRKKVYYHEIHKNSFHNTKRKNEGVFSD